MKFKVKLKKYLLRVVRGKIFIFSTAPLGLIILTLSMALAFFNLSYRGRILPNTYIGKTNFGGLNRQQAQAVLSNLEENTSHDSLKFSWQDKNYELSFKDLEINYQSQDQQTLDRLTAVGRGGLLKEVLKSQAKAVFSKNQVLANFDFNNNKISDFIKKIASDIDKPEKDARIEFENNEPKVIPEEIGRRFSEDENRQISLTSIGSFELRNNLSYKIEELKPKIDSEIAKNALAATQDLISRNLILKSDKKDFEIHKDEIIGFLDYEIKTKGVLGAETSKRQKRNSTQEIIDIYTLEPTISRDKVKSFVEKIGSEIYQEPKDPKFEVKGGRVVAFELGQTGYEIDKDKAVNLITRALNNKNKIVELPIKVTEPATSNNPAEAGIKELIGEGTTDFSGSPENRRHNIKVGAMAFNGVLVKPGEEFSMLKYLGEVDASSGYLPELVIKEDRTIPEYGGGLCQVSTTMFRAALNTGLKITERQNHSYRVRYYEPPVGMDATIYIPKPDFKFLNDFETPILIQASVGANTLSFSLYGTKDGRRAETTDPVIWDVTGAGEPIYAESADLAAGEIKQIEKPHPGSKASFEYRVYDVSGKLINEQKFSSSYVPWPARYLYGPGTTGIPGQEQPADQPVDEPASQAQPTSEPAPTLDNPKD